MSYRIQICQFFVSQASFSERNSIHLILFSPLAIKTMIDEVDLLGKYSIFDACRCGLKVQQPPPEIREKDFAELRNVLRS